MASHPGILYAELPGYRPLLLDLHVPVDVPDAPVVVWAHGGGYMTGDRRFLPDTFPPDLVWDALTTAGIACASIDYRFTLEAPWPAPLDDINAALGFLRARAGRYGLDATRIGVWGESAGGHLALMAALTGPGIAAAVGFYPVTDFLAFPDFDPTAGGMFAGRADVRSAGPVTHASATAPPTLLVHGDADGEVPHTQSVSLHEQLTAAGADSTLHLVPGADHCFRGDIDIRALVDEAVAFLATHLKA